MMSSLATFARVLDAVRGIGWPALSRVRSAVPGPQLSRVRGTTSEFVEHRPYRQGDDPKIIDWKLVGRTDRVYVRLSQERAILPTIIVLDASGSMAFPAPDNGKWTFARQIGIGLAEVARQRGDPVGMTVAHTSAARIIEPRTRRTVLEEMMRAVGVTPTGSEPLAPAARAAARRCARMVLISDFLGDADALLAVGGTFVAAGGELYVIHVVDASELNPDPKKLLLTDPEQPVLRRPMSPSARAEYLRRFAEWRGTLARDWRHAGAVYAMVVPGAEAIRATIRRITMPVGAARIGG
jgi:uncharacterized protein (DUF58 family)